MAKVTSKLQVTLPKRLAEAHRIAPGDRIEVIEADPRTVGESIADRLRED